MVFFKVPIMKPMVSFILVLAVWKDNITSQCP